MKDLETTESTALLNVKNFSGPPKEIPPQGGTGELARSQRKERPDRQTLFGDRWGKHQGQGRPQEAQRDRKKTPAPEADPPDP